MGNESVARTLLAVARCFCAATGQYSNLKLNGKVLLSAVPVSGPVSLGRVVFNLIGGNLNRELLTPCELLYVSARLQKTLFLAMAGEGFLLAPAHVWSACGKVAFHTSQPPFVSLHG